MASGFCTRLMSTMSCTLLRRECTSGTSPRRITEVRETIGVALVAETATSTPGTKTRSMVLGHQAAPFLTRPHLYHSRLTDRRLSPWHQSMRRRRLHDLKMPDQVHCIEILEKGRLMKRSMEVAQIYLRAPLSSASSRFHRRMQPLPQRPHYASKRDFSRRPPTVSRDQERL